MGFHGKETGFFAMKPDSFDWKTSKQSRKFLFFVIVKMKIGRALTETRELPAAFGLCYPCLEKTTIGCHPAYISRACFHPQPTYLYA